MNDFNQVPVTNERDTGKSRESLSPAHHRATSPNHHDRLVELENENSRLHRLVAELLLKNEQLRKPR